MSNNKSSLHHLLVSARTWRFRASPHMMFCSSRIFCRSDSPVASPPSLEKRDILCWTFLCHCRRFSWQKDTLTLSVGLFFVFYCTNSIFLYVPWKWYHVNGDFLKKWPLCSYCTNSIVFLSHELGCFFARKKSFLVHELDENFIPALYDKYYLILKKKNCTNWKFFFPLNEPDENFLVPARCLPLEQREDSVVQTAVPHTQRSREDGAGYAAVSPQTTGGQRLPDGCSPQMEPMLGVNHQPRSPGLLICLYDHRCYGLLAIY